jgi:hypothetical protein
LPPLMSNVRPHNSRNTMDSKPVEWCLLWRAPCLPSSEWASWAQAIFSAAAVMAAIGVVWWQHHVARQNALAAAQLAASGLLTFIDQTIAGLQSAADELQSRIEGADTPSSQPRHLATILGTLHLPAREELLALSVASPDCSIRLLRASNSTRQIRTALEVIATVPLVGVNNTTLPDLLRPLHELASDATKHLLEARKTLDQLSPK